MIERMPTELEQGNQKGSVIPTSNSIGMLGSSYSAANSMKTPAEIGVRVGDSMDDVINGVKGVGFYIDQIGFGAPSTGLTRGMPLAPLGINYFMKNGAICPNGEEMSTYIQGITQGDALGSRVKKAMASMGMPPLAGLAPGMMEDMKNALNPAPLLNALTGSGYPQCKFVKLQVGDSYGNIYDTETGEAWISDPEDIIEEGGIKYQERWVQDTDKKGPINLTKEMYDKQKKQFDEERKKKDKEKDKEKEKNKEKNKRIESFEIHPVSIVSIGILCLMAFCILKK